MILRLDRVQVNLPPPSEPDPAGAAAVQELLGGKFGEMSTWLNYTFQSFNFRARQGARPFYDLLASIATEEFGHVELVSATINTMLTGATPTDDGRAPSSALTGVKHLTGANLMKLFPCPRIPTDKIPESQPHIERREHLRLYRFSQEDFQEVAAVFNGPNPETGEPLEVADVPHPVGAPPMICHRSRECSRRTMRPRRSARSPRNSGSRPAFPTNRPDRSRRSRRISSLPSAGGLAPEGS
jgi:Mn-containing catalase